MSKKTILKVLPLMLDEPKMLQTIFAEQGIKKQYKFEFNETVKYIPVLKEEINNLFISPVVKRTLIQALNVLKAIQIEYRDCEIDSVVIEMAREKNSDDWKKFLSKTQKDNELINIDIDKWLISENMAANRKIRNKVYLAIEQNLKCVYCAGAIDKDLLLKNEYAYEIDHIIPESISFNTKRENLVLVHSSENHKKGNRTAYEYINSPDSKLSWAEYVLNIDEIYNNSLNKNRKKYIFAKKANLKDDTDFNNPEKRLEFINRNLNDTRYSTTEVKAYLDELKIKTQNKYKVKTLNGKYTDFIKKEIFTLPKKDRDDFRHHAVDAIAIAYSDIIKQKIYRDKTTQFVKEEYTKHRKEIEQFNFKFSKKVNTNFNKQLSNDIINSFRKYDGTFKELKHIFLFADDLKTLDKIFKTRELKTLLEINDQRTFDYLLQIYQCYPKGTKYQVDGKEHTVANPFVYFTKVLNQKLVLQKNTKNPELNPEIKSIKYYGRDMGKILDITKNYDTNPEQYKIGLTSLKPMRIDIFQHKITKIYKVFPINARVISKVNETEIQVNKEIYDTILKEEYGINTNEYEKVLELYPRGSLIRITSQDGKYQQDIFEIVGSPNLGKIEVDYYTKRKNDNDSSRIVVAVSKLAKIEKIHTNILGNKLKFIEKESF